MNIENKIAPLFRRKKMKSLLTILMVTTARKCIKIKNFVPLILLFTLISCGRNTNIPQARGVDGTSYDKPEKITGSALPYKYYVRKNDYNKYKAKYKNVENMYDNAAGKNAVDIIPVDHLPSELGDSEFTIEIVDINHPITYGHNCVGSPGCYVNIDKGLYFDETSHRSGKLFFKNYFPDSIDFEYTLLHEMGHSLGVDHIQDEISFMNPVNSFTHYGFSNNDKDRISSLFEIAEFSKDLESMGANLESLTNEELISNLEENYGLSEERAQSVAKITSSFKKIQNKRSLTNKEMNIYTQKVLGVDYVAGKKALENHIQGDSSEMESLMERAADLNGTSPEAVQDLMGEYLLK